jgi:hypothetical protein
MRGLTALFGMGRGEHPRNKHHKKLKLLYIPLLEGIKEANKVILKSVNNIIKNKANGQLVLLDFVVTNFTSIAYQRGSLPQSLKVNSS